MDFSKEFPSLKDKVKAEYHYDDDDLDISYFYFLMEDVQEHTIDRQRVKEVVDKLRPKHISCLEGASYDEALLDVLKNLGLEDE